MSKRIAAIQHLQFGHLYVQYEDDSFTLFGRGEWEDLKDLQVGNLYPPEEANDAVDAQASEVPALERQPADAGTREQNETGASQESGDGPREEGQQGAQAEGIHLVAEPDGPAATSQE